MTEYETLAEKMALHTVDSLAVAEDMAALLLKCGKFRNILRSRVAVGRVIAAGIYTLSHYMPVHIRPDMQGGKRVWPQGIRCRSKVGDIVHLIVLLSHPAPQLFAYLLRDRKVADYLEQAVPKLDDGYEEALKDMYSQMTAVMKRIITEEELKFFYGPEYSFRLNHKSTKILADEYPLEVFLYDNTPFYEVLSRVQNDISVVLVEQNIGNSIDMAELGRRFRDARCRLGLTQKELGARVGVGTLTVTRMESGTAVSAPVLLQFLCFFTRFISIDVFFDRQMWEYAQQNTDFMVKKVHLTSVINRRMKNVKKNMLKELGDLQRQMNETVNGSFRMVEENLDAVINMTNE